MDKTKTSYKISYRKSHFSTFLTGITWVAALLAAAVLLFLVGFILAKGLGNITPDLFALEYNSDNCSLLPAIVNTLEMAGISLLIAVPVGVFAAIFLVEYADNSGKVVGLAHGMDKVISPLPCIESMRFPVLTTVSSRGVFRTSGNLPIWNLSSFISRSAWAVSDFPSCNSSFDKSSNIPVS